MGGPLIYFSFPFSFQPFTPDYAIGTSYDTTCCSYHHHKATFQQNCNRTNKIRLFFGFEFATTHKLSLHCLLNRHLRDPGTRLFNLSVQSHSSWPKFLFTPQHVPQTGHPQETSLFRSGRRKQVNNSMLFCLNNKSKK